jgi:uncharacterized protein (UPF0335 family)
MAETAKIVDMSGEKTERQIPDLRNEGPTREDMLYFLGKIMRVKDRIEEVTKPLKDELKTIKRAAKDHGLFLEEMKLVEKLLTKEMDETPEDKARRTAQYLAWAGMMPKGLQLELPLNSKSTADERLEEMGYQYGLLGRTLPHEEGSDAWQKAMVGWNRGQDVLKQKFAAQAKPEEEADADSSGD